MRRLALAVVVTAVGTLLAGGAVQGGVPCTSEARYVQPSLSADGGVVAYYIRDESAGCAPAGPLFVSATFGPQLGVRPTPHKLTAGGIRATDR